MATHTTGTHTEVIHTTTNHPWLTADHGWLPASFLRLGEPVQRADGTTATVVAIQAVSGTATMWDLTVSNVRTFLVGTEEFVVHNACGPVNAKGEPYPKINDPRTGKPIPYPDGELKVVPEENRVPWDSLKNGFTRKAAYIKEWYDRGYQRLEESWSDYQTHRIKPREYGGTNAFWNLVPLSKEDHLQVTKWWKFFPK